MCVGGPSRLRAGDEAATEMVVVAESLAEASNIITDVPSPVPSSRSLMSWLSILLPRGKGHESIPEVRFRARLAL